MYVDPYFSGVSTKFLFVLVPQSKVLLGGVADTMSCQENILQCVSVSNSNTKEAVPKLIEINFSFFVYIEDTSKISKLKFNKTKRGVKPFIFQLCV